MNRKTAELIPANYRREILLTNMIKNAVAIGSDPNMYYLFTVWNNHVEKVDAGCNSCYVRVLDNWKGILPDLIELEKEESLLNSVV